MGEPTERSLSQERYEAIIEELKGSGLPEVMELEGYQARDIDTLMQQRNNSIADIYQEKLKLALMQVGKLRETGMVPTIKIHDAMEAIRGINSQTHVIEPKKKETVQIEGIGVLKTREMAGPKYSHLINALALQTQLDNPSPKWGDVEAVIIRLNNAIAFEKTYLR